MNQELLKIEREQRRSIQEELLAKLPGATVSHLALNKPINLNRKGLKHCISRRYPNTHQRTLALRSIVELLTKAQYTGSEEDNHVPPRPGIFIHKFETAHEIEGVVYNVWLYVRETPDLLNFYDLGVVDVLT